MVNNRYIEHMRDKGHTWDDEDEKDLFDTFGHENGLYFEEEIIYDNYFDLKFETGFHSWAQIDRKLEEYKICMLSVDIPEVEANQAIEQIKNEIKRIGV